MTTGRLRPWLGRILLVLAVPAAAHADRYERRQRARGEITDTSPRLATGAFIDDRSAPPWRLSMFVDTFLARDPLDAGLLSLRVGMARHGGGPPLPLEPGRFGLSWPDREGPIAPLGQDELVARPLGIQALRQAARLAELSPVPVPFGSTDGMRIPVSFTADPAATPFLDDRSSLLPASWFVTTLHFAVPEDLDRRRHRFELAYGTPGEGALVTTAFRIEDDPSLHRQAFRRLTKQRAEEERRQRRRARRDESGALPSR